jgi:N-acetylneuraminic acid mutarotase
VAVVFGNSLFVHGGYDVDKGIIGDFYEMDISEECDEYIWKKQHNTCDGKEIKLKSHTGVTHKEKLIIFGGEITTSQSNSVVYIYDFVTKKWRSIPPKGEVPRLDSHCAVTVENKMYVYGGYISDKAEHLIDVLAFNIETCTWETVYKGQKNEQEPQGRSNFAMVEYNGNLLIFGGTNGVKTLNDMWSFSLK